MLPERQDANQQASPDKQVAPLSALRNIGNLPLFVELDERSRY